MGRILKAVYSHIYTKPNGERLYFSNGAPQFVMNHIDKKYINDVNELNPHNCIDLLKADSKIGWNMAYNLGNFHYYFLNNNGENNMVPVYEIDPNDDNVTYIFPIEIATSINSLNDIVSVDLDGTTVSYSFEEIIEPIINHLRNNKVKIVVCNMHDPGHYMPSVNDIELRLEKLGISAANLVFIFGNELLTHKHHFPDSKANFTYGNLPLQQQAKGISDFPRITSLGYESDIMREADLNQFKIRPKKFLCFNRSMRTHRYYLAHMAIKHDLLKNSIYSFVNAPDDKEHIRHSIASLSTDPISDSEFNAVINLLPYEIDTDQLSPDQKRGFVTDNNKKEWYADTYFHITSETSFFGPIENGAFFSEKTFRPIINLQPFIFVGDYGSLRHLQSLGFKTFSPYIDESYDLETNYLKRMQMIEAEIIKLNALSQQELHNLYYEMTDILIHNRNHFETFKDSNPYKIAYEFIQQL
jgi:hypothetical protein